MSKSKMNSSRIFFALKALRLLPSSRFYPMKCKILKWAGVDVSLTARIMSDIVIATGGRLAIGNDTFIGHGVSILGGAEDITIGDRCDISSKVIIISGTHEIGTDGQRAAGRSYSLPICIQDGVWIGANATILGGVTIGRCSIVAAGAVVTRNVAAGGRVAGVPARSIMK